MELTFGEKLHDPGDVWLHALGQLNQVFEATQCLEPKVMPTRMHIGTGDVQLIGQKCLLPHLAAE